MHTPTQHASIHCCQASRCTVYHITQLHTRCYASKCTHQHITQLNVCCQASPCTAHHITQLHSRCYASKCTLNKLQHYKSQQALSTSTSTPPSSATFSTLAPCSFVWLKSLSSSPRSRPAISAATTRWLARRFAPCSAPRSTPCSASTPESLGSSQHTALLFHLRVFLLLSLVFDTHCTHNAGATSQ